MDCGRNPGSCTDTQFHYAAPVRIPPRAVRDFVNYCHDHIHDSLEKGTPNRRRVEQKPAASGVVMSPPRLGLLHHRYAWHKAA